MADPILSNLTVTVVCGVFVAGYAFQLYTTPKTNIVSTTRLLFWLSCAGYIFASLTFFLVLSEIILKPGVLPFAGLENAQEAIKTFSAPPVLAAAIWTSLVPNVSGVARFEDWLLKIFQSWGQIPHGVSTLADKIPSSLLHLSDQQRRELNDWIINEDDNPSELAHRLSAEAEPKSRDRCANVLWIYKTLLDWEALPAYAKTFRSQADVWESLKEAHGVFAAESQAFFLLFERLASSGEAGEDALRSSRLRYKNICATRYSLLVQFLAQMLLIVEPSEVQIENKLQRIGFDVHAPIDPPTLIGPFVFIGAIASFLMLAVAPMMPVLDNNPIPITVILLLIGATKTIGLIAAVYPKLAWSSFQPGSKDRKPFLLWLGSAAFAGGFSFVIERVVYVIVTHSGPALLDFTHYRMTPMAPAAAALCLAIAILCDVDLRLGHGWMRRLTEALLCGAAVMTTIVICTHLLNMPSATRSFIGQWFPFALSFSLGFGFGFFGPYLYRLERMAEPRAQLTTVQTA